MQTASPTKSSLQSWRSRPFGRLVEHFLVRLARGGQDASSSEFELGIGPLLGLLAAPGAFQCFLLLDKYSTFLNWYRGRMRQNLFLTSIPDKYEFIALAMAVTGIVTVLKWDKILPDSQDYLNLAPLPVRPRNILLANAAAIAMAVVVFSIDVNGLPVVLFPLFVSAAAQLTSGAFFQFALAHGVCVMLASLFTFCAVFAVLGALGAVLPRETFRSFSPWIRGALLVGFLMLLITGFAGVALLREAILQPQSVFRYLPSVWFLGLYQSLQHTGPAALAELAPRALRGSAAVFLLMVATYTFSYRRRFAATLEGARPPREQRVFALALAALDLFAERTAAFPRGCYRFVVRALLRNEAHRMCIAVALGLGYLLAFQSASEALAAGGGVRDAIPEGDLLRASFIAAYLLILGLRVAFDLPAGVPANWIFRVMLDARENETPAVARRVMFGFVTLLVLAPSFALAVWQWGILIAAVHTAYVAALSLCLIEMLLAGYRKVPLTCPMPGFRDNLLMQCLFLVLGFEFFTRFGPSLERWMFAAPARFPLLPMAMLYGWWWNRRRIRDAREAGELEEGLTFENIRRPAVERMDLS